MFDRLALPRVLPFFFYLFFIFLTDMLERAGWHADGVRWLYAVKVGGVVALLLWFRREYEELRRPLPGLRAAVVAIAVGAAVLVLWLNLDAPWMTIGSPGGFDPRDAGVMNWPLAVIRIAGAALVVPIMEELFWRSFLMRWLTAHDFLRVSPAAVKSVAFIVTVILFGLEHNLWFAGIVAGVAYSLLYMRTGNLWLAILAHAVTNGFLGVWVICTAQWNYW